MDRYPLHRQFIPAHGKFTPVELGGRRIDLLTGKWEIYAGGIRGAGASIYRPANGKFMPVELGGRCIDLSTGTWEISAGPIRGPVHRFIDRLPPLGRMKN